MNLTGVLLQAVASIMVLYGIAVLLRWKGILTESHSRTLAALVTDVFLPAMIFSGMASRAFTAEQLLPAGVMLLLELGSIALAFLVTGLLGYDRTGKGPVVFCSAFGSSTFLGYSIVMQMYPGDPGALQEAVIISEIGVGYPILILGPVLAAHFGSGRGGLKASLSFFRSPVFFALVAGTAWSLLGLPGEDGRLTAPLFHLAHVLSGALTPVAVITVGLLLKRARIRTMIVPLAVVVAIKLIIKPLAAAGLSSAFGLPELWRDLLVIMAAMPPAVMGVVFLKRYGGNASEASALLLSATLISCLTVVAVFALSG